MMRADRAVEPGAIIAVAGGAAVLLTAGNLATGGGPITIRCSHSG
jgi:hypothetical protein